MHRVSSGLPYVRAVVKARQHFHQEVVVNNNLNAVIFEQGFLDERGQGSLTQVQLEFAQLQAQQATSQTAQHTPQPFNPYYARRPSTFTTQGGPPPHRPRVQQSDICRQFARSGRCNWSNCKYRHVRPNRKDDDKDKDKYKGKKDKKD